MPVNAEQNADNDSNCSCNAGNLLHSGILVLLIGQDHDDERKEGNDAGDYAHIVPQEEFHLVLLGSRVNVVSFLPKHRADNDKNQVNDQKRYKRYDGVHERDFNLSGIQTDCNDFTGNGCQPANNGADSSLGGTGSAVRLLGSLRSGLLCSFFFCRFLSFLFLGHMIHSLSRYFEKP